MLLYHGSNVEVREPKLIHSRNSLDFGAGFYTTTDIEQAKKWAVSVTARRHEGSPLVSVFDADEKLWEQLSVLHFETANSEWLDLVVKYRTRQAVDGSFDIIAGPIANDRTIDVINQYISGTYSEEIALQLLLPMRFTDQWALKSEAAIASLTWKEVIAL